MSSTQSIDSTRSDRCDAPLRQGWCPGALQPMLSGDGWLVRVRPRGGAYNLEQLRAIAAISTEFGNGEIDLTSRANLQIRGLTAAGIAPAQHRLGEAGLLDSTAAGESIRNVMVAPLTSPDVVDAAKLWTLASQLEAALVDATPAITLPAKFGVAIDATAAPFFRPSAVDIHVHVATDVVTFELDGDATVHGYVRRDDAVATALRIVQTFCSIAAQSDRFLRMRDLVRSRGAADVFAAASVLTKPAIAIEPRSIRPGLMALDGTQSALVVGLPFGRVSSEALAQLTDASAQVGIVEVRPAPGRLLVMQGANAAMTRLLQSINADRFILEADDPRSMIDVCSGNRGCARGTTDTRADALLLSAWIAEAKPPIQSVHVSGCAKGCARRQPANITLIARDGKYDLVRNGSVSSVAVAVGVSPGALVRTVSHAIGGGHV